MKLVSRFVSVFFGLTALILAAGPTSARGSELMPATGQPQHAMGFKYEDLKWDKIFPELGDKSAEITMLHVDPVSHETLLMIRVPKNFHIPKHWHTANETLVILSGTFILECDGKRESLGPKSSIFLPAKMVHEAWSADEDVVLFVPIDGAWDLNWVDGPPKPSDLIGGR